MLAWNYRRIVVPALGLVAISFLPFAYYIHTHVGMWSYEENLWFCSLLGICISIDAIGFACLLRLIPADADKFSDE